ncbi:MAG: hypothetical protein RL735_749, partial [Pseudomonadota bacterium]
MSSPQLTLRTIRAIEEIDASQWDICANPQNPSGLLPVHKRAAEPGGPLESAESHNPFLSHRFLLALERSRSAAARQGWGPTHLIVEDESGQLLACAPCYLKSHSMGEYVFDHAWADAYERAGGAYYPKLQVAVPFTPVTGPRLLVAEGARAAEARDMLIAGLQALRAQTAASSTHVTFPSKADWDFLGEAGWLKRTGKQFHFLNRGYENFDGFLAALSSRKRKNIRKEREAAGASGIEVHMLTGADLLEEHWDAFF